MRLRTLLAIVAVLFALPAFSRAKTQPASPLPEALPKVSDKQPSADALVAISDVRLDAALDDKTAPGSKDTLLDLAREGYQKALKQEPKNKNALLGIARFYARTDEKEKTVEAYKTYLALNPSDADAACELAVTHARWKDWAGACSWCEFALKINPENPRAKKTHGFCLASAGKWDEAFAVLSQVMPEAQARHNLGGLLNRTGHTDASKAQLRLAVKADPTFTPARNLLVQIEGVAVAPAPRALPELVTKVYSVGDLVVPPAPLAGEAATTAYRKSIEELVQLVTGMVQPYTWKEHGGRGSVEYFDIGTALVVQNTPAVLEQVSDVIEVLHRLAPAAVSVAYEVRVLKVPAGFCERVGVKVARDTTLTPAQFQKLLDAAQGDRTASVTPFPKVTAINGQTATAKTGEEQSFVTGLEIMKIKGQIVYVPKNVAIFLGDALTLQGRVSADANYVHVRAGLARTHLVGPVELVPVATRITPVFEGGSQGQPVPFTQFIQVPDVRKEHVEKSAIVPTGETLVIGEWKEIEEIQGKNPKSRREFEVVAFATVRVVKDVKSALDAALKAAPLPQPVAAPAVNNTSAVYKLRNIAAADAVSAISTHLREKKQSATVVAEPVSNAVLVSAQPATCRLIATALAALDKEPQQVVVHAAVVQVPRGFVAQSGLRADSAAGGNAWTLSPREAQMLTGLFRAAKERGECDVLSRPQMCVCDNQTGYARVGQSVPVAVAPADGSTGQRIAFVPTGIALRVTPRVAPDDKTVLLRTNLQITSVGNAVQVTTADGPGRPTPSFGTQTLEATVAVAFGDTLVVASPSRSNPDHSLTGAVRWLCGAQFETLVILTPERVAPAPEVRPAGWFTK